ncbi:MAG: selenide, water dikinase SelD [Planctomycetes bacterium]|nr:selenide, water dikinase SelD [Planctomycetota bacterium]
MPKVVDPNVLVGTETHDDAGVYRLTDEIALVQTIDFFPPVVDDAYRYGQIAAANSLSDVYAMGGVPKTGLNLVGYPDDQDPEMTWLGDILKGGAERFAKAGAVIIGGHTVRDAEIKFGYAVTGLIHPQKIFTNANAKPGDKLILTKPLGTGFVTTAHKRGDVTPDLFEAVCQSMIQLNDIGRDVMIEFGAHAATDVTGFGLAGHAFEMALGSKVTIVLNLSKLPLFKGVEAFACQPYLTRASATNASYVESELAKEGRLDPVRLEVFYDAQTSGGILMSVPADKADAAVAAARARGATATCVIGEVVQRGAKALVVRA